MILSCPQFFFFFNDTATTEIYTLPLHDALPIFGPDRHRLDLLLRADNVLQSRARRSEEHTSELQSQSNLVCRLLLEKKKKNNATYVRARSVSKRHMYHST